MACFTAKDKKSKNKKSKKHRNQEPTEIIIPKNTYENYSTGENSHEIQDILNLNSFDFDRISYKSFDLEPLNNADIKSLSEISFDIDDIIDKNNCNFRSQKEQRVRSMKIDELIYQQQDLLKNSFSTFFDSNREPNLNSTNETSYKDLQKLKEPTKQNMLNIHRKYSSKNITSDDWLDQVWKYLEKRNGCDFSNQREKMRIECDKERNKGRSSSDHYSLARNDIFDSITNFGFSQNYDFILSQMKNLEKQRESLQSLQKDENAAAFSNISEEEMNNLCKNWLYQNENFSHKNSISNFLTSSDYFSHNSTSSENSTLFDMNEAVQAVIETAAIDQHIDDNLIQFEWKNPDMNWDNHNQCEINSSSIGSTTRVTNKSLPMSLGREISFLSSKTKDEFRERQNKALRTNKKTTKKKDKETIQLAPIIESNFSLRQNADSEKAQHIELPESELDITKQSAQINTECIQNDLYIIPEYDQIFEAQWNEICRKNNIIRPDAHFGSVSPRGIKHHYI